MIETPIPGNLVSKCVNSSNNNNNNVDQEDDQIEDDVDKDGALGSNSALVEWGCGCKNVVSKAAENVEKH